MIRLLFEGREYEIAEGLGLSGVLPVDMPCGGHGKCGKCKVKVKGMLSDLTASEKLLLTEEEIAAGVRLACAVTVLGDCEVSALWQTQPGQERKDRKSQIVTQGDMPEFPLHPGFERFGAALDIGTTTLAGRLYSADGTPVAQSSRLNPQGTFGADVISRIEASLSGEGKKLAECIVNALDEMLCEMADEAGIRPEETDALVVTGNTAMLYLLTGSCPETLSHAPFEADRLFGESLTAGDLGFCSILSGTEVYLPSCMAAFVGADTVCALLSSGITEKEEDALLVDIGTNGEMALMKEGNLLVCSTAAGPAFEGGGISMGMRGSEGAVDRVVLKDGELSAHVIGDSEPAGICGSGLIDAVACLLQNETLDETGYLEEETVTVLAPVELTQQDIRMVQLAKSSICAGMQTLLLTAKSGPEQVKKLYIAGGFGHYLNMENAALIGLIPQALTERIKVIGNAALSGASMILLNREFREKCRELAGKAQVVELSSNPVFADKYMMGMMFEAV